MKTYATVRPLLNTIEERMLDRIDEDSLHSYLESGEDEDLVETFVNTFENASMDEVPAEAAAKNFITMLKKVFNDADIILNFDEERIINVAYDLEPDEEDCEE